MKTLTFLPLAMLVVGCVSSREQVPTEYVFKDLPTENRVEVLFTNDTGGQLCLLPEHWPNQAGKINQAGNHVFLIAAGERFPMEDFNTGYCPGGCATVIRPGETVTAFISYDDFELPAELRNAPKQLELPVVAYTCP